jgi:hypothetical protein
MNPVPFYNRAIYGWMGQLIASLQPLHLIFSPGGMAAGAISQFHRNDVQFVMFVVNLCV